MSEGRVPKLFYKAATVALNKAVDLAYKYLETADRRETIRRQPGYNEHTLRAMCEDIARYREDRSGVQSNWAMSTNRFTPEIIVGIWSKLPVEYKRSL